MWWDKKPQGSGSQEQREKLLTAIPSQPDHALHETSLRNMDMATANLNQTVVGRSMSLRGDLSGKEDLLIDGQFEGNINLADHCVTVGANGQVKADVHARQVIVQGTVTGNVSAGEKIEIRKTGRVVGDLVAAAIAIEDGAFFKGSIDIVRDQPQESPAASAPQPVFGSGS